MPSMQIDAKDAFSTSQRADLAALHDAATAAVVQSTTREREDSEQQQQQRGHFCPLSSSCQIQAGCSLLSHLREAHQAQLCEIVLNEQGVGAIEADTPVWMGQGKPRRSTLIIQCGSATFLWSLESRYRADGEIQVSVIMRSLDDIVASGRRNSIDSITSSSSSSSTTAAPKSPSSSVVTVGTPPRVNSVPTDSWQAIEERCEAMALQRKQFRASLTVLGTSHDLSWEGVLGGEIDLINKCERQEHLVSRGAALVCLYPTHMDAFKAHTADKALLTVRTQVMMVD